MMTMQIRALEILISLRLRDPVLRARGMGPHHLLLLPITINHDNNPTKRLPGPHQGLQKAMGVYFAISVAKAPPV